MTHICVSKLTIIGWGNGMSPGRRRAIIWTNAGILLIWPLGTNFGENLIEIHTFSFTKICWKMSSGKWQTLCLGLNVLTLFSFIHLWFILYFVFVELTLCAASWQQLLGGDPWNFIKKYVWFCSVHSPAGITNNMNGCCYVILWDCRTT